MVSVLERCTARELKLHRKSIELDDMGSIKGEGTNCNEEGGGEDGEDQVPQNAHIHGFSANLSQGFVKSHLRASQTVGLYC